MTQIVLQPSGSKESAEHWGNTINRPVKLSDVKSKLNPSLLKHLKGLFPNGEAPMWGVTPGLNYLNESKWAKVEPGAVVLFAGGKKIYGCAVIAAKFRNKPLAKHLWGVTDEGMAWEFMYALDEVRALDITYREFNKSVGYKAKNRIQGFNVLDEVKSQAFLDTFDLNLKSREWPPNPSDVDRAIRDFDELDKKYEAARRVEQSALRDHLLQGKRSGKCFFCGRTFHADFLHAAHIKKRAECNNREKRDLKNIGMLNCLFGCDQLYERGYISVATSGKVVKSQRLLSETEKSYMATTVSSKVQVSAGQRKYFDWHLSNTFRK